MHILLFLLLFLAAIVIFGLSIVGFVLRAIFGLGRGSSSRAKQARSGQNGQQQGRPNYNLTETLNDVTAHAEMQAITAAANVLGGKYLNECTLYVTVEPCVMCAGAIAWAQTGKLVFGAEDDKRGYQRYAAQALHPKTVVVKGILADECATLMKDFFASKRR